MMLDLDTFMTDWRPPIEKVVANQGEGITELIGRVKQHREYIEGNGELVKRRTKRTRDEMMDILNARIGKYVQKKIVDTGRLDDLVEKLKAHETDPYTVADELTGEMLK